MLHGFITGGEILKGSHFIFDHELLKCRHLIFLNMKEILCAIKNPHSGSNFNSLIALESGANKLL
jgi:hypothetical protein